MSLQETKQREIEKIRQILKRAQHRHRGGLSIMAATVRDYMRSPLGIAHPIEGPHTCDRCHWLVGCQHGASRHPTHCEEYIPVRPPPERRSPSGPTRISSDDLEEF